MLALVLGAWLAHWYLLGQEKALPTVHRALFEQTFCKLLTKEQCDASIAAVERLKNPTIINAANEGNLKPAEDAVRKEAAKIAADPSADNLPRARSFADLAVVTYRDNVNERIKWLKKATELAPEMPEYWQGLGLALQAAGNLTEALRAYDAFGKIGLKTENDIIKYFSAIRRGDVSISAGKIDDAIESYAYGRSIARSASSREPGNLEWQRQLSVSYAMIGDVLQAQVDLPGALASFRAALEINKMLTLRDPGNMEWQRDLSITHNRIGGVLSAQGDLPGTLTSFQNGLVIAKSLSTRAIDNLEWQRDLSVSHNLIGDVQRKQGDLPGALASFHASLATAQTLAARDKGNMQWQRDLAISHNKIGDILSMQGDLAAALTRFSDALAIAATLAARDPGNMEWQRDLIVSHVKMAASGNAPSSNYQRAYEIAARMQRDGKLAPVDAWIVEDTKRRWQEALAAGK
jgi:tetratricopeptide (TPR) repeat protein